MEKITDAVERRAFVVKHLGERQHHALAAENPNEIEPAQRVDGYDAAVLQVERNFGVTHGTAGSRDCAICSEENGATPNWLQKQV
jgi:hypothetical protein